MRNGSKRLVGSLLLLVAAVPVPSFATSADFNQQMPLGGLHATVATGGHAARFPHRCARFWTGRSIRRRIGSASGRTGSPAMGHGSRRRSGWPCKWVRASVRSIRTAVATIARACFAGFNMRPIRIQGHVAFRRCGPGRAPCASLGGLRREFCLLLQDGWLIAPAVSMAFAAAFLSACRMGIPSRRTCSPPHTAR